MHLTLLLIAAQGAQPGPGPIGQEYLQTPILPQLNTCAEADAGENRIVVCGRRGNGDRYRIPETLRDQEEPGRAVPGDVRASLDASPFAPCGIFAGQRQCSKAEAARFGYGNGRDPVTAVGRIITELVDPD